VTDFFDVVLSQRAARSFTPEEVDDATVARILTAATHAPTAENSQPFVFIVVRDPDIRSTIGAITARVWEGGARDLDVDQGAMGGVAKAPVLIVVAGDTRLTFAETLDSSLFPAVQNLLLAAHALGLGSTLTTLPVLSGNDLSEALDLPPEIRPVAVVPIGHLPKPLGPPRRLPISEKAHLNRYGVPFTATT
jgi:nitroreductase